MSSITSIAPTATFPVVAAVGDAPSPELRKEAQPQPAPLRLVIEERPDGGFIYKTLDRLTGEVVSQTPSEDVMRLQGDPDYAAGDVFSSLY